MVKSSITMGSHAQDWLAEPMIRKSRLNRKKRKEKRKSRCNRIMGWYAKDLVIRPMSSRLDVMTSTPYLDYRDPRIRQKTGMWTLSVLQEISWWRHFVFQILMEVVLNGQTFPPRNDSYLQWFRDSLLTYIPIFLTSHTTKPTGRKKGHCTYWPRWIILSMNWNAATKWE